MNVKANVIASHSFSPALYTRTLPCDILSLVMMVIRRSGGDGDILGGDARVVIVLDRV